MRQEYHWWRTRWTIAFQWLTALLLLAWLATIVVMLVKSEL